MLTCASCTKSSCERGDLTDAPKNCPCLNTDAKSEISLYDSEDLRTARVAANVEAYGYMQLTRVEEIMEYALRCGYKHIGIGFCMGLHNEAKVFCDILKSNGFEVDSVGCKVGSVSKEEMGLTKEDFVGGPCPFQPMCNPKGQAHRLDEAGCELNVLLGLCVGHDTLFIKESKAPITVLSAKDRVTGHAPLNPIYTASSYRTGLYDYVKNRKVDK